MKNKPIHLNTCDALAAIAEGQATPPDFDATATLAPVDTKELLIDPAYQRRVSKNGQATIRRILRGFSWSRFGALTVAKSDLGYVVIDGQHRAIAAFHLKIDRVPCVVVEGDQAHQARDFVDINTNRTVVGPVDKFRARVVSGEADAVELNDMLIDLKIDLDVPAGHSLGPRQTRAISRLQKLIKRFGQGTLYTSLEMLIDAQPETPDFLSALVIEASVMAVDAVIENKHSLNDLQTVFEELDPITLNDDSAHLVKIVGGRKVDHAAKLILKAYNKGRKNRIDLQ